MGIALEDLGPAQVLWGGVDLGESGDITFRCSEDVADHTTAQYGASPKDQVYVGNSCEVEVNLKESTNTQLATLFGNATVTADELMVGSPVGTNMRSIAAKLVIKPYVAGAATADADKWLTIFVAAPQADWEVVFNADGDREYKGTFKGFRATSVASGETYAIGDLFAIGYGEVV